MKRTYQRSPILSFYEMNETQQQIATNQTEELAAEDRYVLWNNEPLPLSMFLRTNSSGHGIYSLTAFSAYFIYINRTGEEATVVYAYC